MEDKSQESEFTLNIKSLRYGKIVNVYFDCVLCKFFFQLN